MNRPSPIDALLLVMTIIWGANYTIVKHAFREIDPQAFNALRMALASVVFVTLILWMQRTPMPADAAGSIFRTPSPITRRDWLQLAALGIVGHCLYQYFFIDGLAHTSVTNSSLMLAAAPVIIALVTAARGHDRIGALHWIGVALSVAGIYVVVGHTGDSSGSSLRGDLMMLIAVCCWAAYTMGAQGLMQRHSPVGVTGLSMAIGSAIYVPVFVPRMAGIAWRAVSMGTWLALLYSALLSLAVSYTIWYAAVREIGSARTSVYSNLVPVVAMLTAIVFLGEPVTVTKVIGAAAVVVGVGLTRIGRAATPVRPAPSSS